MQNKIRKHLGEQIRVLKEVEQSLPGGIADVAALLIAALQRGNKLLIMGNGGSAADAQHFAAELVGRYLLERRALPAIALTTDSSILTSVGNDYGFDDIFSRQVEALAASGDLVMGISTSGDSENVLRAIQAATDAGCQTIGLLGGDGGRLAELCDHTLIVPAQQTPHIQEAHTTMIHLLCELVEQEMFGEEL